MTAVTLNVVRPAPWLIVRVLLPIFTAPFSVSVPAPVATVVFPAVPSMVAALDNVKAAAPPPIVAPPEAMVIGPTQVPATAAVNAPAGAEAKPVPERVSGSALVMTKAAAKFSAAPDWMMVPALDEPKAFTDAGCKRPAATVIVPAYAVESSCWRMPSPVFRMLPEPWSCEAVVAVPVPVPSSMTSVAPLAISSVPPPAPILKMMPPARLVAETALSLKVPLVSRKVPPFVSRSCL